MKKMIAVLLSLMLALSFSCAALAEEPAAPALTAGNWLQETLTTTDWIEKDGRATLEVAPVLDDQSEETFEVTVPRKARSSYSTVCTMWRSAS